MEKIGVARFCGSFFGTDKSSLSGQLKLAKNLLVVGVCLSAVLCLLAYTAKPGTSASSYSVT